MTPKHYLGIFIGFVLVAVLSVGFAAAQTGESTHPQHFCPAPISVCGPDFSDCPPGYVCTCVSSCPACDDCAAFVCTAVASECRTACDCPNTLGCFDGQCIAGFAPVYCCDRGECPIGQQCQSRDGTMLMCDDTTCQDRVRAATEKIETMVERHNRCRHDRQCAWVSTSTECQGSCGAFVRRNFRKRFDRRIRRLDRRVCTGYQQDGCPYATPGCIGEQGICINRRCAGG